ncbi:hypothetical protein CQW23_17346 [Capsicum baccatum]|uniref:Uncharacterized protein n=1 Tax=Capsicum baccatum TaxID=33114 RepID=A0A2G2WDK6_CAPBA|nr:hypothetical protein CQW23_17346 [Capsicum baccatum]
MVFIDVVIAGELSQTENRNFVEFLIAVACRDGSTAVKCTLKLSKMQNCSNSDVFLKEVKVFRFLEVFLEGSGKMLR